jgi:hypothetical protein
MTKISTRDADIDIEMMKYDEKIQERDRSWMEKKKTKGETGG